MPLSTSDRILLLSISSVTVFSMLAAILPPRKSRVAQIVYPCFGGPLDGRFLSRTRPPVGYKEWYVEGRMLWLYKKMKADRLDYATLLRVTHLLPPDQNEEEFA